MTAATPSRSAQIDAMLRDRARADGTVPRGTVSAIGRLMGCNKARAWERMRALGLRTAFDVDEHGTLSRANTAGCPCDDCRDAKRRYQRDWRRGRTDVPHGTVNGYKGYDCRCALCTAAVRDDRREYMRAYRQRRRAS